jgi:hypothetical protein
LRVEGRRCISGGLCAVVDFGIRAPKFLLGPPPVVTYKAICESKINIPSITAVVSSCRDDGRGSYVELVIFVSFAREISYIAALDNPLLSGMPKAVE